MFAHYLPENSPAAEQAPLAAPDLYPAGSSKKSGIFWTDASLEYIIEHEGCTQKDLADFLHISAPSVAVTVKRLERDGVIQRAADEKDLRCNRLKITQAGLAYVAACRQSFDGVDALAFRGFSDEECAALYGYLQRLTANLETDEFRERSVFSLIDEDERFHAGLQIQEKEEEKKRD